VSKESIVTIVTGTRNRESVNQTIKTYLHNAMSTSESEAHDERNKAGCLQSL